MITLGAFVSPMTPGNHIVRIKGGYFGAAVAATYQATYGFSSIVEDLSYIVHVQ